MIVLIPAYQPDEKLVELVRGIHREHPGRPIVVVDDGSGPTYRDIFHRVALDGSMVLTHDVNRGKGAALKRGLEYCVARYPGRPVVTADCDGQHTPIDIGRVGERTLSEAGTLVLGVRSFVDGVPVRSRFGNQITRAVFWAATGVHLADTQTGLRGYHPELLEWVTSVEGDRFEYETNLLLEASRRGTRITEVSIETVYVAGNAASHFRPLVDSVRVFAPLMRFSLSSLVAFVLDFLLVLGLNAITASLVASVVGARVTSSVFNYLTNRNLVFERGAERAPTSSATRYFGLVGALLAVNYLCMWTLAAFVGLPLAAAKVVTELSLFATSYHLQRRFVFAPIEAADRSKLVEPAVG